MRPRWRTARWAAAWTIATLLLWLAFRSLDWPSVLDGIASAEKVWIGVALVLNLSILFWWTLQWLLFLPAPAATVRDAGAGARDAEPDRGEPSRSFGRMFEVVSVMSTVANSVPFMAGQAAGVHLLATRGRTGHAIALSVLALDQLAEGLAKVGVLALLAALVPLPSGLREAALAVASGVTLLAGGLVAAAWLERRSRSVGPDVRTGSRGTERSGLRARAGRFVRRFAAGLEAIRSPRILPIGLGLALAMKAAEGGAILAVQAALGVELPFWVALLVLATVGLATMVSVAPANLGMYEASAFAAYRLAGVAPETAAALAILQHALFLVPAAGTGWLVLAWRGRRRAAEAFARS